MRLQNLFESKFIVNPNKSVEVNIECETLSQSPITVENSFYACGIGLKSLEGGPLYVKGDFDCSDNQLTSLKDSPLSVGWSFGCNGNKLTSFEGITPVIGKSLFAQRNNIKSLVGISDHIKEIGSGLNISNNPIEEGGLGLFLIKGFCSKSADFRFVFSATGKFEKAGQIINQYRTEGPDAIWECQKKLIEAGLEEFAQI